MKGFEIERKWLVAALPEDLEAYPFSEMEQAYLNFEPVLRVRRSVSPEGESYELTYKGDGGIVRREENLPLDKASYENLRGKHEGRILRKRRYRIPLGEYVAELDIYSGDFQGLRLVEVEFGSEAEARAFQAPEWFGRDVSETGEYSNSRLARMLKAEGKPVFSQI